MATLTVRNPNDEFVKRLRVPAAKNGRSAEAERRKILRMTLAGGDWQAVREQAVSRLAEFRHRTGKRGSPLSADLLDESRRSRLEDLASRGA